MTMGMAYNIVLPFSCLPSKKRVVCVALCSYSVVVDLNGDKTFHRPHNPTTSLVLQAKRCVEKYVKYKYENAERQKRKRHTARLPISNCFMVPLKKKRI